MWEYYSMTMHIVIGLNLPTSRSYSWSDMEFKGGSLA